MTVSRHEIGGVSNVKAVVAAFNQEKALVGALSMITNLRMELFEALVHSKHQLPAQTALPALCVCYTLAYLHTVIIHQLFNFSNSPNSWHLT